MYSLCDHCGNTGCVMQSGIPRVSCAAYIQRVTLEDYIQQIIDDTLKKKEEEKKECDRFVWAVSYTSDTFGIVTSVFDNEELAQKHCDWLRCSIHVNPQISECRVQM